MLKNAYGGDVVGASKTLIGIIQELGLSSGLQLCFDAGDALSYSGSGQVWSDLSGNGADMNRGSASGIDAADPTFNGSAGALDETAYWSFDGSDIFTPAAANSIADTWAQNNAQFSIIAVTREAATSAGKGICGNATSNVQFSSGFIFGFSGNPGKLVLDVDNGSWFSTRLTTTTSYPASAPAFYGCAFNEASDATLQINATQETFTPTATTQTGTPSKDLRIADDGLGDQMGNTDRMYLFAAWNTRLSDAQLTALYTALKSRRFPSMA